MTRHVYFGRDDNGIFVQDVRNDHATPATPVIGGSPVVDTMHLQLSHKGENIIVYWREAEIERESILTLVAQFLQD